MMLRRVCLFVSVALACVWGAACNSDDVRDAVDPDVLDVADGVPRKTIDRSVLGVNAFAPDGRFGSPDAQFRDVRDTLGLSRLRILFRWDDAVQPSPSAAPNFSFFDDVVRALPPGTEALAVVTGVPGWMNDPANWRDGNPRSTFVDRWVRPVAARYGGDGRIVGFEIWNEPNAPSDREGALLGLPGSPENYVELLARAQNVVRETAPGKLVIAAATTAINQNYPDTLRYNERMRDAGAASFTDRWNVHYYGRQFENVVRDGGVADFLNGLPVPVWVTESGAQGVNEQLPYGEQVWPFLREEIPSLERIYIYQYAEATPAATTYGLRNLSSDAPVSDLYVWLRDNK